MTRTPEEKLAQIRKALAKQAFAGKTVAQVREEERFLSPVGFNAPGVTVQSFVAEGIRAEIVRPAPLLQMAAARRKVEVERLARASLRRLVVGGDPHSARWGTKS